MSISTAAALGSTSRSLAFLSHLCAATDTTVLTSSSSLSFPNFCRRPHKKLSFCAPLKVSLSDGSPQTQESTPPPEVDNAPLNTRRSADWKTARLYNERGLIYEGRVEAFNAGGLLVRFHSLLGFLPFPELSRSYSCSEPHKPIQAIARGLIGSFVSVKVLRLDEGSRTLILSEKEAIWSKFSHIVNVGDIFEARVGVVEDFGAFADLRFPDGCYYLAGLIHVSEVSWDFVSDARDVLNEGEDVKVKILTIDRAKSRITLSIKQLEEDPLLETLEKVIPQDGLVDSTMDGSFGYDIEPFPGLESRIEELLQEDGRIILLERKVMALIPRLGWMHLVVL